MRNLKKFLALALAMVMAFSLMVTANAAHAGTQYNDEDTVTPAFSEAVEVLTGMGVFQGDSGSFRPASNITRAEVAAIIYRLATGDTGTDKMDLYTTRHPFTDVRSDAWYAGYVGYLYNAKIIKGTTTTTFNPTGNVTGYEVLAMILRAVGYDKNDEFTGATWTVEVASTATNLGILRDIDSTHYGDTLHLASRRDVVASMLFRTAAFVPMVQYTLAFGYRDTGMVDGVIGTEKNPSLGVKNFNLSWTTGIVVGNQATGEDYTKVGEKVRNNLKLDYEGVSYQYESKQDANDPAYGTLVHEFRFNTGLDLFGHQVRVWYNGTPSATLDYNNDVSNSTSVVKYRSRYATYAVVDKASMDKTVFAENAILNAAGAGGAINLMDAANANGFSANTLSSAYMSDRYSQFSTSKLGNGTATSKVNMYRLISNSGKGVDVVIALNQEVAMINQVNTTIKNGEYIYLGKGASQFGDALYGGGNGMILFEQLSGASVKALGTVVTAHQIVGTTNIFSADTNDHTYANANGMQPKYAMYETKKLEPSMTGTIATYKQAGVANADGSFNVSGVTLTDGTVINLSGITGSLNPYGSGTYEHLIDGVTKLTSGGNTYAGVTYSFYKDEVGRFIGVSTTSDYSFLYTTFLDYQVGNLGTGTISYYAYGVDWDGNIVKDKQITSIEIPVGTNGTSVFFDRNGAATTYPSTAGGLALGYGMAPVTRKNQGNISYGNEITNGANTRFMVNAAGNMNWYSKVGGTYGREFIGFDSSATTSESTVSIDRGIWQITSTDVVNGFARVYGAKEDGTAQNAYLLTNATKFIVVTGSGTADLSVKIYNGISELVGNGSYAEIDGLAADNVYFRTNADMYGNVDTSDNATIHTVIMSDTNLKNYGAQSLFFSEPGNVATNTRLAGAELTTDTIRQYKLYSGGQVGYYWINETVSSALGGDGTANGQANFGDFYQLTPIDTINGQTIYRADKITDTSRSVAVNATYDYVVVNDMSTAEITFSDLTKTVFKVSGANVTLALGDNDNTTLQALFPYSINISDIQTLNHAVSMGKANASGDYYEVKVAIVFSGINVVDIYVTNITQS